MVDVIRPRPEGEWPGDCARVVAVTQPVSGVCGMLLQDPTGGVTAWVHVLPDDVVDTGKMIGFDPGSRHTLGPLHPGPPIPEEPPAAAAPASPGRRIQVPAKLVPAHLAGRTLVVRDLVHSEEESVWGIFFEGESEDTFWNVRGSASEQPVDVGDTLEFQAPAPPADPTRRTVKDVLAMAARATDGTEQQSLLDTET